jgi:hypothetical protein
MGRPADYQWKPLGLDSDPVPGDPGRISEEAAHLATEAEIISQQVATLRQIAANGTEVGKHADVIRSKAGDLAGQLQILAVRYRKVSTILQNWIPDLEKAQAMSIQALDQAEEPYAKLNQTVVLPSGSHMTAQQKQQVQDYHNSMNQASNELNAAIALLHRATSLRDSSGSDHANQINNACNDGMRDHHSIWGDLTGWATGAWHWVEGAANWVSDHWVSILKDLCTVLEAIATILAIIALFIPGLDIIVILGIAATALALAGRFTLAATGHGSWMDVALDAFALLTFGTGKILGSAMRGAFESSESVAKTLVTAERDATTLGKFGNAIQQGADLVKSNGALDASVSFLDRVGLHGLSDGLTSAAAKFSGSLEKLSGIVLEKASPSIETTLKTVDTEIKPMQTALYGGEKESLLMTRKMAIIAQRFPESPQIAELGARFNTLLNFQRGVFGAANAADQWDHWVGGVQWYGNNDEVPVINLHLPGTEFYSNFKEHWKTSGGIF